MSTGILDDETRARIRAEEQYRAEVRLNSQAPKSIAERVLAILSTGFVLWFLSTVGIGLLSYFHNRFQQQARRDDEEWDRERKLNIEIHSRLLFFERWLPRTLAADPGVSLHIKSQSVLNAVDSRSGAFVMNSEHVHASEFAEFRGRSLDSLLADLIELEAQKKVEAAKLLDANRKLRDHWFTLGDDATADAYTSGKEMDEFKIAASAWTKKLVSETLKSAYSK